MSNVLPFPNEREVREAATLWISRFDRGLSNPELTLLREWLDADPRHRSVLFEMAALWDRMDLLGEMSELFPLEAAHPPRIPASSRGWAPALAAVVILALVLVGWLLTRQVGAPPFEATYRTRVGEQRTVELPDGSVVMLNTATLLTVHYTEKSRSLELLEGEAHFQVAKNAYRVFGVRAGTNEFRAIGTAFDIRFRPDEGAALTVTEGRVQVLIASNDLASNTQRSVRQRAITAPNPEIMVDAGEEVAIGPSAQTVKRLDPVQLQTAIAWQHGMVLFEGRPLEDAIREVSRYSNVRFRIDQEQLRHLPVSGYFKIGDIDALLASLENNFSIEATREGNLIALHTRPMTSAEKGK